MQSPVFHRHRAERLDVMGSVCKFNGFCVDPYLQRKKGPTVPTAYILASVKSNVNFVQKWEFK